MEEVWKSIDGFENYMVSNYGKLKRIYKNKEKIIKGCLDKKGNVKIKLRNNGNVLNIRLTKLVAQTFIRDLKENEIAIHIDGDKLNNRYDNLKILTLKEAGKISGEKSVKLIDRDKLEKDFIEKFNSLHGDKWEYVGGYTNSRNSIIIKCKICGSEINIIPDNSLRKTAKLKCNKCEAEKYINNFKIEFNNKYKNKYEYIDRENNQNAFTEDIHIIKCLKCGQLIKRKGKTLLYSKFNCNHLTDEEIKQRRLKNEINKTLSELSKEIKDINNRNELFEKELSKIKECEYCGRIFYAKDYNWYCSDICKATMKKEKQKAHKRLREAKAKKNGKIEWNISLEKLIQRDEGICKICGRQVDTEDYYYTEEGYFIAGDNYPSIDHIIPLAKGGTHTWNNIQLAHRHCNTIKSDNIIEQEEEQLKWI